MAVFVWALAPKLSFQQGSAFSRNMSKMTADTSRELGIMCLRIGMQLKHKDKENNCFWLSEEMRKKAVKCGAVEFDQPKS